MPLTTLTLSALLDAFSSPDPTPGGGSAAALSGALGASLLAMVAGMPKTKSGTPEERRALDAARKDLLIRRATLESLVDRDAAAYDLVVAAYRRPKATPEDQAARKAAIGEAMRVATEVPLETMQACAEVLGLGKVVAELGNRSAASDVGVGMHLAMTGLTGARFNVEINLSGSSDGAFLARVRKDVLLMMVGGGADLQAALRAVELRSQA